MTNNIPAGYQIHFNSWENDADARGIKIWSGIESPEDVKFLLVLASKFFSRNAEVRGIGNNGVTVGTMIDTVENAIASVPGISFDMRALFDAEREDADDDEDLADRWYDLIAERILGYPVEEYYQNETRFCRVFEDAQVYYFPQPVEDVTADFR